MPFDPTRTRGCCVGNCEHAKENGGKGCDMCDRVAKLPQPHFKKVGTLQDDSSHDVFAEPPESPLLPQRAKPKTAPAAAKVHATAVTPTTNTKRRPAKGPQTGSLLDGFD